MQVVFVNCSQVLILFLCLDITQLVPVISKDEPKRDGLHVEGKYFSALFPVLRIRINFVRACFVGSGTSSGPDLKLKSRKWQIFINIFISKIYFNME